MVNDLAEQLRPAIMKLSRELRREVRSLGVTGGQVSLLFSVKSSPGVGVRELAARERMSPAGMSGHVQRLVKLGLLRREDDPDDARRYGLYLTDEGARILRRVKDRRTAWLAARLRALPARDLRTIERALVPLARLLEAEG
jgi:DNA-binding MarR family transcriptional regulator